jgi:hypothetical protein
VFTDKGRRILFGGRWYVSISGAADILGISVATLRRRQYRGDMKRPLPLPIGNKGTQWFDLIDLERMVAAQSEPVTAKRLEEKAPAGGGRPRDLRAVMDAMETLADDGDVDVDAEADVFDGESDWADFTVEGVEPWERLQAESSPPDVPTHCRHCPRPLMVTGVMDQYQRRWLIASCEVPGHGDQGRAPWR